MSRKGLTVTVKLNTRTKTALDIYAAKIAGKIGKGVSTDEAIWNLLEHVDKEAVEIAIRTVPEKQEDKPKKEQP